MQDRRRVLIVDDEEALACSLSLRLEKLRPRLAIDVAHDGPSARTKLRKAPPDLLVADVVLRGMNGIDLVLSALATNGALPVIVTTAAKTADLEPLTKRSSIKFLEKPFAIEQLLALVDQALAERRATGFSGAISVQTLPDIVQLYVLSNTTGMLTIRHETGEGAVWFEQGSIPHAATARRRGEEAFYEIMAWSGGEFSMQMGARAPERSVRGSWQELLMESCRRLDEHQRDPAAAEKEEVGWTLSPPPLAPSEPDVEAATVTDGKTVPAPGDDPNVKNSLARLDAIDGFVGAALVDVESGMLLGSLEADGSVASLAHDAQGHAEVVRAGRKTMSAAAAGEAIEDMLFTLDRQYHLVRPLRSRPTLFVFVALDRPRANLAMARLVLADVEANIQNPSV